MEPGVPFVEIDEFVSDAVCAALIENFVHGSSKPFWIGFREFVTVVAETSSVFVVLVECFEVFCIVREENDSLVGAPSEKYIVVRLFSELIFRLNSVESSFTEQTFEDPSHVFIEKDSGAAH